MTEKIYWCPREEDARALMGELHNLGYRCNSGDKLTANSNWNSYREETCYFLDKDKTVTYTCRDYCYSRGYEFEEYSTRLTIAQLLRGRL